MSDQKENFYISPQDLERLVTFSERIHSTSSNEPFLNHLYVVLKSAIPNTVFSVDSYCVNPIFFRQAVNVGISEEQVAVYKRYMTQHPLAKLLLVPDQTDVYSILTETTSEEFHKTDLYQKFYRELGIEDQLVFTLPYSDGVYVVAYCRDTAFSEWEKTFMKLLKPQLHIALRSWQRTCEMEQHLRTLETEKVAKNEPANPASGAVRRLERLSRRQKDVARLVAQGLENRAIAEELHISPKTVGKHLENIFTALEIHHRAALATLWQQAASAGSCSLTVDV